MILWDGGAVHEGIRRYLAGEPMVAERDRCVGCDIADGGERGWCDECWNRVLSGEPWPEC